MKILPFHSQHTFCLMYITSNKHLLITNQEIHNINTRSNSKLHIPGSNLTKLVVTNYECIT